MPTTYVISHPPNGEVGLISKNPQLPNLTPPMLRVAGEELAHYGLIHELVVRRGWRPEHITPSPYMGELLRRASRERGGRFYGKDRPRPLLDRLLIAALVEARSCERFRLLARRAKDGELARLFSDLVGSEAAHFGLYIDLAKEFFPAKEVARRLAALSALESKVLGDLPPGPSIHSGWKFLGAPEAAVV